MGVGVSCCQIFEVKNNKLDQEYRENSVPHAEADDKGLTEPGSRGKNEPEISDVSKKGYLNLQTEDKESPLSKETRHMSLQTTAEIKEVKLMQSGGKRATMPNLSYQPKEKWGGSVPAFFQTTKQEIEIGDTLTPGKRRLSSRAHEFEVIAVNHRSGEEGDSAGHWEDKFEREARSFKKRSGAPRTLRPIVGSVRVGPLKPLRE